MQEVASVLGTLFSPCGWFISTRQDAGWDGGGGLLMRNAVYFNTIVVAAKRNRALLNAGFNSEISSGEKKRSHNLTVS